MKEFRDGRRFALSFSIALILISNCLFAQTPALPNPILFVTQAPIPDEWMKVSQTFGNHIGHPFNTGRGGDLWIRYPDGELRNLTEMAGYGVIGFQGSQSIAVRDPAVHWDGTKAVFSMVVGAPDAPFVYDDYFWQLYEIIGLGQSETPVIAKVPNQPENFNNISPIYGTDDRIIFTSDRPRNGAPHLYPQLDEYESAATVTGIWSLNPADGDLFLLNHSPSGSFQPFLDSFGRVIYTRWDHLQRDQQNEGGGNGAYNWDGEGINAQATASNAEFFPEPRTANGNLNGHRFESFLPWEINEDGTEEEVLNHIGRHELLSYFTRSFTDDPNLTDFFGSGYNQNRISHTFQLKEDPTHPGRYYAIDSPTFYHHSAGQIIRLEGDAALNPDSTTVTYLTPDGFDSGHFRHPLPLSDGTMISAYTAYTGSVTNLGSREFPRSPFRFRLMTLQDNGSSFTPGQYLTNGIHKTISYWDPDVKVTFADSIPLWEFDPVEVVARLRPTPRTAEIESPEQQIFDEEGITVAQLQAFLEQNELALIVSRNLTTRDAADKQQPYNLRVSGTATQTLGASGQIYDIAHLQLFQGDQIRSYQNYPDEGRRVLAVPMHEDGGLNLPNPGGPASSVKIGDDGSMAAFIPARRALTWQITDDNGGAVVRERYWVTFQPGEIRVCAGCHGVNTIDQAGNPAAQNPPEALRDLMQHYQSLVGIENSHSGALAKTPHLLGNYPNPFNPETTIRYVLPKRTRVNLTVYNLLGEKLGELVNDVQAVGEYAVKWDGENLASGVYLYTFRAGSHSETRKMVLLR